MTRLLVIGDALLDTDIDGTTSRLMPDEAAPVVDVSRAWQRPGGAGLAASLLASRGDAVVILLTALGDDDHGQRLAELLATELELIKLPLAGGTVGKSRIRVGDHSLARLDSGDGVADPSRPLDRRLRRAVEAAVAGAGAILVADYGRGVADHPVLRHLLQAATTRIPVVWDPHPRGPEPVPGCRLVSPNLAEARTLAADSASSPDPAVLAARLRQRWQADAVAVTTGADGAVLAAGDRSTVIRPTTPPSHPDVDCCGAGDRFAGAATAALAGGTPLTDAVGHAVDIASRFVAAGAAAALNLAADSRAPAPTTAFELAEQVRRRGGRVVATGGCFDLVHPGHLTLLRQARALGDALVVCVNSDDSVRRLKGSARPVMPVEDRVRLLSELRSVDATLIFGENSPAAVLDRLRPDIWVKGDDYDESAMPEAAVVRRHGGEVRLVPTVDGYSTTRLLQEVASR